MVSCAQNHYSNSWKLRGFHAFIEITEGTLFLPGAKDERSPLKRGGFSCFRDTPSGRHRGGVLQGYGYCQPEGQDIQGHRQRETVALFVALQEVAM